MPGVTMWRVRSPDRLELLLYQALTELRQTEQRIDRGYRRPPPVLGYSGRWRSHP